ncbi:alpha-L-arabinofuranosidase [Streptomyces davaonensis JCM 4913]|uniref:Alpha-L-arabinofuranosidase n=1 Tax=Streptomyces davaonensis (strain DSM 101723 / JCM 4913 / KCC S-0913 / 768) TaxID=1214101 RepID=K4R3W0_STRDJ|nr:AbfB domain-containing protein [Streptomyces davaonensis]CCK30951.1 alpha-L-arabinofuranosidase [Streptomyces davaonensis JCM 4913]
MPNNKSRPPQARPWESGWAPETSRTPGTRRLWLAGALALATIGACVTAIAVTHKPTDGPSQSAFPSTSAYPPGLISFATPSASTASPAPSAEPDSRPSAHSKTRAPRPTPTPTPSRGHAEPSASSAPEPATAWRSVRSVNYPDRSWQVSDGLVRLTTSADTFKLLKGLAEPSCYSFATADGSYLRHREFLLRAEPDDGSALFAQDATFCPRASSHSGAIMLESVNFPGRYLRHRNFQLRLDPHQSSELYLADSAFRLTG